MGHDLGMRSRVHPKYKTKYRVSNWAEYDRALVQRGDITLWISTDATDAWKPAPSGRRGGQRKFSDHTIETALMLRLVFKLPLRQAEGFLRSLLSLMGVDLEAPDHTTLSRRSQHLDVDFHLVPANEPIHLIVDSTGLSIIGEGEWAAAKHGGKGKRGWRKLHLGVDGSGVIVAQVLTDGNADDAATVPDLLGQFEGELSGFVADAAYDSRPVYDAATQRGAVVVVPPTRNATVGGRNVTQCSARDRTVARIREVGRRQWKKESGYHRQGTVENAFFRYKSIIGDRLRARHSKAQEAETLIACNILNGMTALGRPASYAIGA
jgi:IS5 family transposase